jgi:hypothetical protein
VNLVALDDGRVQPITHLVGIDHRDLLEPASSPASYSALAAFLRLAHDLRYLRPALGVGRPAAEPIPPVGGGWASLGLGRA